MAIEFNKSEPNGNLDLVLPDWASLDSVRRSRLPFALWHIGDQPLLHHWFDYAVNQSFASVRVHVSDRPAEVRRAIDEAALWPIDIQCVTVRDTSLAPGGSISARHLPALPAPPPPTDGWSLLDYAATLEEQWLLRLAADPDAALLAIGGRCRIHPSTVLTPPYFIGEGVAIGPGCSIGPKAVIGAGSLLVGESRITHSHVSPHTSLGPMTALDGCILEGNILYNRRHRARVAGLETHLASSLATPASATRPPLIERLHALRLLLKLRPTAATGPFFTTTQGLELPIAANLPQRLGWLREVVRGRLRLFGVLPRSAQEIQSLPADWQQPIESAPAGVISYADCHGCHSTKDPEEAIHAIYQATQPPAELLPVLLDFTRNLERGRLPAS